MQAVSRTRLGQNLESFAAPQLLPFLLESSSMARITINRTTDNTRIRIAGRLTAADMRRLEHACAAALVVHPLRLRIDVASVTEVDATAAAVLAQLSARGAVIQPHLPK
jgi:ABC-type transporter Mla MlaB component